jgi:hypothetical protein
LSLRKLDPRKEFAMADKPVLTTAGNPPADNRNSPTAGPRGPVPT